MTIQDLRVAVKNAYDTANFSEIKGSLPKFVDKTKYEVITHIRDQLNWKRSPGLIFEFICKIFGLHTPKDAKILKAIREYKINTLQKLFNHVDVYAKYTSAAAENANSMNWKNPEMLEKLHEAFPQFSIDEIYLLIAQREKCEQVLKKNGITYATGDSEDTTTIEKGDRTDKNDLEVANEVWKEIRASTANALSYKEELVIFHLNQLSIFDNEIADNDLFNYNQYQKTGVITPAWLPILKENIKILSETELTSILKSDTIKKSVADKYEAQISKLEK